MSPSSWLLPFFLLSIASLSLCSSLPRLNDPSAFDLLQRFGFPGGLLPQTIVAYDLDDADGIFTLKLGGSCAVDIPDAYPVKYASQITGSVSYGRLADLTGISVKVFYVWWDITTISVSGEDLVFKIGPASATYPVENFIENPVCEGSTTEEHFRTQKD